MSVSKKRIQSLDQFRGATLICMLIVNSLSDFNNSPWVLVPNNAGCDLHDVVMPQFYFCSGYAFRLAAMKHSKQVGEDSRFLMRVVNLFLFGVFYAISEAAIYDSSFPSAKLFCGQRLFQVLVNMSFVNLLMYPVRRWNRISLLCYAGMAALLHFLLSCGFYFDWSSKFYTWDGGPLGFLSWNICFVAGMYAHDEIALLRNRLTGIAQYSLLWKGFLIALIGYLISCLNNAALIGPCFDTNGSRESWEQVACVKLNSLPPVPFTELPTKMSLFTMSTRSATTSYTFFAAGWSMMVFSLFYIFCDPAPDKILMTVDASNNVEDPNAGLPSNSDQNQLLLDTSPSTGAGESKSSGENSLVGKCLISLSRNSLMTYMISLFTDRVWMGIVGEDAAGGFIFLAVIVQLIFMIWLMRDFERRGVFITL